MPVRKQSYTEILSGWLESIFHGRLSCFDGQFRELISSGAPVDLSMNAIHSLFLLQNAAKSQYSSGGHEPASVSKRQRVEKPDLKKSHPDYSSKSKSKGFAITSINRTLKEGISAWSRPVNLHTSAHCVRSPDTALLRARSLSKKTVSPA